MDAQNSDYSGAHTYNDELFSTDQVSFDTIIDYLKHQSIHHPNRIFITELISIHQKKQISFAACYQAVQRWQTWARNTIDFNTNPIIGVFPSNSINSIITILGILSCNSAILFLNPDNPIKRSNEQLQKLNIKTVFLSELLPKTIYPSAIAIPEQETIENYTTQDYSPVLPAPSTIFYFGTSGSTAASKIVAQSSVNAIINALALKKHHQLDSTSRIMGCLPIYHVNGLHFTVLSNIITGSQAFITHGFNPFEFPKFIEQYKPTIVSAVPSILEALLEVWRTPVFPDEFRYFVTAAAPLSSHTANKVYTRWNKKVMQGYGLTETTNFSTKLPIDISEADYKMYMLESNIPSIGCAIYGNEVEILDEQGQLLAEGEIGEICMRGFNVMNAYFGNKEATTLAFKNGWFHSGDIGYYRWCENLEKKLFFISGRTKNIAKVRGTLISLEEIERLVAQLESIADVACVRIPQKYTEEEIVLVVCYHKDKQAYSNSFVVEYLKQFIPSTVVPQKIIEKNIIPRTPTGKLKRKALKNSLML